MENIFTKHPKEVGETYLQHGIQSMRYSLTFLFLFTIALIHAILPFLFKKIASDIVCDMGEHMECRKGK
jgi:hypothetical protein